MHRYIHTTRPHKQFLLLSAFLLVCMLAFSACGTNTTTGSSSGNAAATPTSTTGVTQGPADATGCPNHLVVTTAPTAASVTLTTKDSNKTVTVSKGALVEIDLPFGQTWSGPVNLPQDLLTLQSPAGYAFPALRSCVWRFTAGKPGTVHLSFIGRPLCKKGQLCPMYVMAVPFTIEIK